MTWRRIIESQKGKHKHVRTKRCKQSVVYKRNFKGMKPETLEADNRSFINDSLSSIEKGLWYISKRHWTNKYLHILWASNSFVKIKVRENSKPNTISHIIHLETLFPDNKLLNNKKSESDH